MTIEDNGKLSKVEAGRKGGMSRSSTKRRSSSANLALARMKRWPGRELAKQLAAAYPVTPIIVTTQAEEDAIVEEALVEINGALRANTMSPRDAIQFTPDEAEDA